MTNNKIKWRVDEVVLNRIEAVQLAAQRPASLKRIQAMAADWNDALAGTITLGERPDGSLYLIDGQHRKEAKQMADGPDATMPAFIVIDSDLKLEAWLFSRSNSLRNSVQQIDLFRADVTAGVPDAIEISRFLEGLNVRVSSGSAHRSIAAIATLRGRWARDRQTTEATLHMINTAFGDENNAWSSNMISAIWRLFDKMPDLDQKRLLQVLRRRLPDAWLSIQPGKWGGSASGMGGASLAISWAIGREYDKNLRKNRLEMPAPRGMSTS